MSVKRWAAKRDKSEPAIVAALIDYGCTVTRLSDKDVPDLLVGYRGVNILMEIKSSGGRFKAGQIEWHDTWAGQVNTVMTPAQAIETVRRTVAIPDINDKATP